MKSLFHLVWSLLFLKILWVPVQASESLPTPCRAYRSPCGTQEFVCNTEENYQRSLIGPQPACPVSFPTAPPPVEDCELINGSCQFTNNSLSCRTWLPSYEFQYRCGSEENYTSFLENSDGTIGGPVPPPSNTCIPINESCQWYNPCRLWPGWCSEPYQCGTLSEYWAFVFGPQPTCAWPPREQPLPPGDCIVQNGTCSWSDCRSWLDICQFYWHCGTDYQYQQYSALPPPPCPFPGDHFHPPPEPGVCQFNVSAGSCRFVINTTCPEGKEYQECGSGCPLTCENYQDPPLACLAVCVEGCFCPDGTVEYGEDMCLQPSECPTEPTTNTTCLEGKEYQECGTACPLTCENYQDPPLACLAVCVQGCFCPDGTVEYGEDMCLQPSECPTEPTTNTTCPEGKEYQECGTACPLTCENYQDPPLACLAVCVQGCFCPDGTVEYGEDMCLQPSECPTEPTTNTTCPEGKEYQECGTACPLTCENYQDPPFVCPAICVQGCFCPDGMVEYGEDMCLQPSECPTEPTTNTTCPRGKEYQECGTACPLTCENYNQQPLACTLQCVQGCFCPDGTVEYGNMCLQPSECPTVPTTNTTCPEGKEYQECGSGCPLTCENYQDPPTCFVCLEGCFCPDGTVEYGNMCLQPSECPTVPTTNTTCPEGKEYQECGSGCPLTCENYQDPPTCFVCLEGCFCPDGTVEYGNMCLQPSECPTVPTTNTTCPEGKEYQECGSGCPLTCENYQDPPTCFVCLEGCFCPDGTVEYGNICLQPSECPTEPTTNTTCPEGKEYQECGTACPLTCENYQDPPLACLAVCVEGCFCPDGTVEYGEDMCLQPSECPTEPTTNTTCPEGKEYQECGTACPLTCENYQDPPLACLAVCVEGCFCPDGTVEYGEDMCLQPSECPTEPTTNTTCPGGKEYQECGTACPLTCENYQDPPFVCPAVCVQGCFCSDGTVEYGEDMCLQPSECPTEPTTNTTCPRGKEYQECGTACPLTCENYNQQPLACTLQCVQGCFCPDGMVEYGEDMCLQSSECPTEPTTNTTCPRGKEYQECGTACPLTCENYNQQPLACTRQCVQDCFCPDGLVENGEECIQPSNCPQTSPCAVVDCAPGYLCRVHEPTNQAYCDPTCDPPFYHCGDEQRCTLVDGNCDPAVEPCPHEVQCIDIVLNTTCPRGKEYQECGTACPLTCENYNQQPFACTLQCVLGCFCPEGLVENGEECIQPSDCPQTPTCPGVMEYQECGSACPLTCANLSDPYSCTLQCVSGCFCPNNMVEHKGRCIHPSACPSLPRACPPSVDNPCPSTSRCLWTNSTREAFCLESCFMSNGGCGEDQVCVTEPPPENCDSPPCSSATCEDLDDTGGSCPPGWMFDQCGSYCQATCDDYLLLLPCLLICAPGCVCPPGLVAYRDRCVDPQECTALFEEPPPVNPLPQPDDTALVELTVTGMSREEFENQQESLLQSVRDLLLNEGYTGVGVTVYAVLQEEENLQVVLRFKGNDISSRDSQKLNPSEVAALVADNSESLPVEVAEVSAVEAPILGEPSESGQGGPSDGAIAGIVLGTLLLGTVLVLVVVFVVVALVVAERKRGKAAVLNVNAAPEDDMAVSYLKLKQVTSFENEYVET